MPGKQCFQWGNKCLQLLDEFVGLEVPSIPKAKCGGEAQIRFYVWTAAGVLGSWHGLLLVCRKHNVINEGMCSPKSREKIGVWKCSQFKLSQRKKSESTGHYQLL